MIKHASAVKKHARTALWAASAVILFVVATAAFHRPEPAAHFVTVATDDSKELASLLRSSSYPVSVLGKGKDWNRGPRTKLMILMDYMRPLPANDVLVFLDGTDTMFFPCGRDLVRQFLAEKPAVDLVFAADWKSYPDRWKQDTFPAGRRIGKDGELRWLNSGTYIGRVGPLRRIVTSYMIEQGRWNLDGAMVVHDSDQRMFSDAFLTEYYSGATPKRIVLDYAGKYFQMFREEPDVGCWKREADGGVRCKASYDLPACLLHSAGLKQAFWEQLVPNWHEGRHDLY